jgi:tetratricopeptide (TPR) repeat protein
MRNISRAVLIFSLALGLNISLPLNPADSITPQDIKAILPEIQTGNYQNAISQLKSLLRPDLDSIWQQRIGFLLAYLYEKKGDLLQAERYYRLVIKDYKQLEDHIVYRLGKVWLGQAKAHQVNEVIKSFGEKYPLSCLRAKAQVLEAHALRQLGNYPQAILKYKKIIEGKRLSDRKERAETLFGWAEALTKMGNLSQAWSLYSRIYFDYPEQDLAEASYKAMSNINHSRLLSLIIKSPELYLQRAKYLMRKGYYSRALKDYDNLLSSNLSKAYRARVTLYKGICFSKLRQYPQAINWVKRFIKKYPKSKYLPEGLYYLARFYWNTNESEKGEAVIRRLITDYPSNSWTERGMLILGLMKEEQGKWSEAQAIYQKMLRYFPQGKLRFKLYWRLGWVKYLQHDYLGAAQSLKKLTTLPKKKPLRARAIYWYARTLEKSKQKAKALTYYKKLLREYPFSYYGIKGEERWLNLQKTKNPENNTEITIKNQVNRVPIKITWSDQQNHYLEKIQELALLGLFDEVQQEFNLLNRTIPPDPLYKYHLAKFLFQNGLYYQTIRILTKVLRETDSIDMNRLPADLWQLIYPRLYWDQIVSQAKKHHQDPYLILAIIRQESAFQPWAISPSDAQGLMQILPSTGRFIYQQWGKTNFSHQNLFDPNLNISLGVWYFNYLWHRFNQSIILALAGYNAGPDKVQRWVEQYSSESLEEFVENIPYKETRDYIKSVIRNHAFYQKIYGQGRTFLINSAKGVTD